MQEKIKSPFSEWAERLRRSDRDALAELFKAMSARLVRYAQTFVNDEQGANDVLQDVFLKLWEVRETLKPDSSLQALLYTMTRNMSLNMKRKQGYLVRSDNVQDDAAFAGGSGEAGGIEAELEAQYLKGHLYRWIEELPARRKEAFVLSRHFDLSHREISEIMGLSERTVNTHIFLALKHLRNRLDTLQHTH